MNILQIVPELNVGGVERGTVDLARFLVRYGHKAIVVSCGGGLVKELEDAGAKHYYLPVHKKSLFNIISMVPKLVEIINKEEIDIVHARSRVPAWIAFFACRKTNKVFITTCHGYYSKHLFSRVMGWGKLVISPSNIIARHMRDDFAVSHQRLRLIPRSVDLEKFTFVNPREKGNDTLNIGIIGRLTPLKGHIYFLKAMSKVIRAVPGIRIWIVGDAPASKQGYKDDIRIMVRRLGLSHCTEFLGTQKDIPSILADLNLLVLASITPEAFGRVIIEAQACGVPVVANRIGGVVDIIDDGVTGILVPPVDPPAMAEAIIKILRNKKLATNLAQNAYKKVKEKFTLELMVKKTIEVYKEALLDRRILLIKLSSLGDLVLSTAAIAAIREKFPSRAQTDKASRLGYKISLLVGVLSKDLFVNCPHIDELIVYGPKDKGIIGIFRLVRELWGRNFDLVFDLQNNRLSHWLSFLSSAPLRYGYDNKKFSFLLNHRIKDDSLATDPLTHQFRILKMVDIELKDRRLEVWPAKQDCAYVDEFLKENWLSEEQVLIGLNITASRRWKTKAWPEERIIRLCELLALKNIRTVLTGTEKDLAQAKRLEAKVKNLKPIVSCGKTTINQLVSLIKRCQVFVSGDSAPLHIACALDTAFVALFGPTQALRHLAPNCKGIILSKDLACSPCYDPQCKRQECMSKISANEVMEAIEKLLENQKSKKI